MRRVVKESLFVLCLLALAGCEQEKTAQQYIDSAKDYLDRQELGTASLELKNALRIEPNNAETRWLLGKAYYDLGDFDSAEKELLRAGGLGVDNNTIAPLVAEIYLKRRKLDDLQGMSVENLGAAALAEVRARQALGLILDAKLDQAADFIKVALASDMTSRAALLARAQLFFARRDLDNALEQVRELLDQTPEYADAWSLRGDIQFVNRQTSQAEESFSKAIAYRSLNIEEYTKRALARIQLRKFAEAQQDIDHVNSMGVSVPGLNYAQGLLHYNAGNLKAAREAFELALRANKDFPSAQLFLGIVHLLQANYEQADYYGSRYLEQVPSSPPGRKLVAMVKREQQDFAGVERLLGPIVAQVADDGIVLNLLAEAKLKLGKREEGVALLEKVSSMSPDSAAADFRLGLGYLLDGDQAGGIDHIQSALELDPSFQQADIALVMHHLRLREHQKALAAAENYRDKNPQIAAPWTLLGGVYLAMGKQDQAEEMFKKALQISPGDPSAAHNLAGIYLRSGAPGQARELYRTVLAAHDNNLTTLMLLAALDAREQKEQLLVEHLQAAIAAHPLAVQPRSLLTRYFLGKGETDKAGGVISNLAGSLKQDPEMLSLLAQLQLREQRYAEAQVTLQRLVNLQPGSAQAHFLLSSAYAGLNNAELTKKELETAIEIAPRFVPPRLVLTRVLLNSGQLTLAERQLVELKGLVPELPVVTELEATLAQKRGDNGAAVTLLENLYKKSPSTEKLLNLARMQWRVGNQEGGLALMESWVADHPGDLTARLELANAYSLFGRADDAIGEFQQVLKLEQKNVIALNNLAWHFQDSEPGLSLDYATTANEIQPDVPYLKDTLAVVLLKNGELRKAQDAIRFALDKVPDDPAFRYHSALIADAAGDSEEAFKTLTALMSEDVEFAEKSQAETLFNRLTRQQQEKTGEAD